MRWHRQPLDRITSSLPRYGKPLDDGFDWPADSEAAARLLQGQAVRMVEDLGAVGAAFAAPLQEVAAAVAGAGAGTAGAAGAAAADGGGAGGGEEAGAAGPTPAARAANLAAQLGGERDQAAARVRDALRELLFVLVVVALHREGRLSGPPADGEEAGGAQEEGAQGAATLEEEVAPAAAVDAAVDDPQQQQQQQQQQ
jgi:hypothetical protein